MISRQGLRLRAFLESEEEENYWVRTKKIKWWFSSAWFVQEVITTSEAPSCHCFPFGRRLVTPSSGSLCRVYTCPPKDAEPTKHVLKQKNRGLLFPMPHCSATLLCSRWQQELQLSPAWSSDLQVSWKHGYVLYSVHLKDLQMATFHSHFHKVVSSL